MNRFTLCFVSFCTLSGLACESAPDADGSDLSPRAPSDAPSATEESAPGARGEHVQRVYTYLARYGYFPNPVLAQQYPGFVPLVAEVPRDPEVYDATLERAVRAFQELHGLPMTGIADAATLALMTPRDCGFPDGQAAVQAAASDDPHRLGFHIARTVPSLTWSIESAPPGETVESIAALVGEMAAVWETVHPGSFARVTNRRGNFGIGFRTIDGRSTDDNSDLQCDRQCILGQAAGSSGITLDATERWSFRGPIPAPDGPGFNGLSVDLQSVVLHEIGHVLGIQHSDRQGAVMFPRYTRGSLNRSLSEDDRLAVRAGSSAWTARETPAPVTDVHGAPLAILTDETVAGGGGKAIYRGVNDRWERVDGGATRISGDARGRLWIVRDDGAVRLQTSDGRRWITVPGCARDIGVGGRGGVWIIDCEGGLQRAEVDPTSDDDAVARAATAGFQKVPTDSPRTLSFVSVAGLGGSDAVVLDAEGGLHRIGADRTLQRVPLNDKQPMADIGAALTETIWAGARSGQGVFALNIQSEIKYPPGAMQNRIAAYTRRTWQGYPTRSVSRVSVDAIGRPLVVDQSGKLFTTTK